MYELKRFKASRNKVQGASIYVFIYSLHLAPYIKNHY